MVMTVMMLVTVLVMVKIVDGNFVADCGGVLWNLRNASVAWNSVLAAFEVRGRK